MEACSLKYFHSLTRVRQQPPKKDHLSPLPVVCIWFGMTNRASKRTERFFFSTVVMWRAQHTASKTLKLSGKRQKEKNEEITAGNWGSVHAGCPHGEKQRSSSEYKHVTSTSHPHPHPHLEASSDQTQQEWTRIRMRNEHVSFMPA